MPSGAAALVVTLLGLVLLVVPGMLIAGLLIGQAQQIAGTVLQSPIIARFSTLQVQGIPVDPNLWKVENFRAFLEYRRAELARMVNVFLTEVVNVPAMYASEAFRDETFNMSANHIL